MRWSLLFAAMAAIFLFVCGNALALTIAPPYSYKKPSPDGQYLLVMISPRSVEEEERNGDPAWVAEILALRQTYRQSGLYRNDRSTTPLWTVGWYAYDGAIDVASDGVHLVRRGAWGSSTDEVAVSFFARGVLTREYKIKDLIDMPFLVSRGPGYYYLWAENQSFDDATLQYSITTVEGSSFVFDVSTGRIIFESRKPRVLLWSVLIGGMVLVTGVAVLVVRRIRKRSHMRSSNHFLMLGLLVLALHPSPATGEIYQAGEHRIEVTLVSGKPAIMLGEPVYLSFILHNHSEQDLQVIVGGDYRNRLGRPESFTVTVAREDGKRAPQPDAGQSMGGISGPQKVPARGSHVVNLFLPHWATIEEAGTYSIEVKRSLVLSEHTPGRWDSNEKTAVVQARVGTKIEVVARDHEKMGEVIAELGKTMLEGDEGELAGRALVWMQDERVIPYFVKAMEARNSGRKSMALRALGRFENEAAFEALKRGMETRGEDIDNTTTRELAEQSAEGVRHSAAAALAGSPHPGAIPFLVSRRSDSSIGVRITVLHALGRMKPHDAIPILKEMADDKDERVSNEAKRYLKLLSQKE